MRQFDLRDVSTLSCSFAVVHETDHGILEGAVVVDSVGSELPKLIEIIPRILSTGIRFHINGRTYIPLGLLSLCEEDGRYILGVNIANWLRSPITR